MENFANPEIPIFQFCESGKSGDPEEVSPMIKFRPLGPVIKKKQTGRYGLKIRVLVWKCRGVIK